MNAGDHLLDTLSEMFHRWVELRRCQLVNESLRGEMEVLEMKRDNRTLGALARQQRVTNYLFERIGIPGSNL